MTLRHFLLLSACVLITACSKINQDNYSKIQVGMNKLEVEDLLGTPSDCSGALGLSSCTWGDEKRYISIQYAGDKVVVFAGHGLK